MTTQRAARSAGRGKQWSALLASERLAVAFWRKGDVFDGPWVHWGGGCRGVRRRDARASRPQTYRINAPTNAPRQGREVTSPKPAKPRNQAQNHQPDPEQGGVKRSVRGLTGAKAPAFPRRRRRLAWSEAGEVGRAPPFLAPGSSHSPARFQRRVVTRRHPKGRWCSRATASSRGQVTWPSRNGPSGRAN